MAIMTGNDNANRFHIFPLICTRKRQEAKAKGVDYERVKALETQADHAEASYR